MLEVYHGSQISTTTRRFVLQTSQPLCHKLYGSMGYAGVLHVQDSRLKLPCSRWNLRPLVNPQHLSKSPDEIEVFNLKVIFEL